MPPVSSRWIRIAIGVLAVAAIAAVLRFTVFREEIVPVTVFRVARGAVEETVTNSKSGTVETRRRALLSTEVGGRVLELSVREGDEVVSGQVLMRLADADGRAQVAREERGLDTARAAETEACLLAEQAGREYERSLRLATEHIVSKELLEQAGSARDVARASCATARARILEVAANLELARVNLEKSVLRAPFDGVVAQVTTEVGEWITPSPPAVPIPPVIELLKVGAIYVTAPLDEVDVAKLRVDLPVRITLEAYPGRAFSGKVVRIAPYVTDFAEHSRTFEIEVELDDTDFARTLLPGTSADVEVILEAKQDVLRIPSYALIEGSRVLLLEQGRLVEREVETALQNWAFAEITAGLSAGESVVVSLDRAEVSAGARARSSAETLR